MKISELSRRSGLSLSTLKYYQREGFLPPGEALASNQASYSEEHLRRLELIRAMREVGHLGIETIRKILGSLDRSDKALLDLMGEAVDALSNRSTEKSDPDLERKQAAAEIEALLQERGVQARPDAAARLDLIDALVALRHLMSADFPATDLRPYLHLASELAREEIACSAERLQTDPTSALERVVQGTLLFEPILIAFRRLAHEHFTREALARSAGSQGPQGQ